MKLKFFALLCTIIFLAVACKEQPTKGGRRFNYTVIKDSLYLTADETKKFDEITESYTRQLRANREKYKDDKDKAKAESEVITQKQDEEIKILLGAEKFEIYQREVAIERKGREKHNLELIKTDLGLDSTQQAKYDMANEAFFKTLRDNHDNYHGKPDVYQQYYTELDVSRKEAFKQLMTPQQYEQYIQLTEKYKIGKFEK